MRHIYLTYFRHILGLDFGQISLWSLVATNNNRC